jgi:hypothetical protein
MTVFGSICLVLTLVGWSLCGIGRRAYYGAMIALGLLVVGTSVLRLTVLEAESAGDVALLISELGFAAIIGGTFGTILFRSKPKIVV